jgi:hypothetical protein
MWSVLRSTATAEALGAVIMRTFFRETTVSAALSGTVTDDAPGSSIGKATAVWTKDEDVVAAEG